MMHVTVRKLSLLLSTLTISVLLAIAESPTTAADDVAPAAGRLFEMRTYTTAPDKLDALHQRFREHTNALFVKHGMALLAYWTPEDQPDTLIYILAYPDRNACEASWEAFLDDPEWQRVWEESKKSAGGPIVTKVESTFMTPTDYSPIH